jgi:type IV secretion system protein VirD4
MSPQFVRALLGSAALGLLVLYTVTSGPPETVAWRVLANTITFGITLAAVRFVVVGTLRLFGAWHPEWYQYTLILPWRLAAQAVLNYKRWKERVHHLGNRATARWSGWVGTLTLPYDPQGLFLGRPWFFGFPAWQPIAIETERHAVMIAAAGTGKTTHVVTQIALHADAGGNAFVVDPKGQISRVLANLLNARVLDPQGIVPGVSGAAWNALQEMRAFVQRHGPDAAVRYAAKMAEALIADDRDKFFSDAARAFLAALILYVFVAEPDDARRHLVRVRELLTRGYEGASDGMGFLLEEMERRAEYGGMIAGQAAALRQMSPNTSAGVLATARVHTAWLDFPEMRAISTRSDITLEHLKTGTGTRLFVTAPATDVSGPLRGWFRLLTVMTLYTFESTPGRMRLPCLTVVDECPALGRISALETAAPLLRSYGVRLLVIAQDVGQLMAVYSKTWEGFLGSAEAVFWFGTNHMATAEYLERVLGQCTKAETVGGQWWSKEPKQTRHVERPLMYADQIKRFLDRGGMIVTRFGRTPLRLKPCPFFTDLPVWLYDADPAFTEQPLRAFTRRMLQRWREWRQQRGAPPLTPRSATPRISEAAHV